MGRRKSSMESRKYPTRMIIFSLASNNFTLQLPNIVSSLLLIEMANTFNKPIGIMGQLRTISSLTGIIVSLLMGLLSVKYRHKSLIMIGMFLVIIASTGFLVSSTFTMIMIFYSLLGIGRSTIGPMNTTILGEHVPSENRTTSFGLLNGAAALAYLIGSPAIAYISDLGSWRLTYQIFIIPLLLGALILMYKGIPPGSQGCNENVMILEGYKSILRDKSAVACLVANMVSGSIWISQLTFSSSYVRTRFLLSKLFLSYTSFIGAPLFIAGSLICGRWVSLYGRRMVTFFSCVPSGLLLFLYYNNGNVWLTLVLGFLAAFSNGVLLTASGSLILEQVPEFRGTLMSLASAVGGLGGAVGITIVGRLIDRIGFSASGYYMIITGILSSLIYYLYVGDPSQID
jgi:DHA1 family putative efflux transporter-like MFS transporter